MNKEIIKRYIAYILLIGIAFIGGAALTLPKVPKIFIEKEQQIKSKASHIKDLQAQLDVIEQNKLQEQENNVKVFKIVYEPEIKSSEMMVNFNGLLEMVLELAKQNGLKTRTIEFKPIPESDLIKQNHSGTHDATLLTAQMVGTYTELQNFLREIDRSRYLIGITEIKVSPYDRDKKILIIDLSLALYAKK